MADNQRTQSGLVQQELPFGGEMESVRPASGGVIRALTVKGKGRRTLSREQEEDAARRYRAGASAQAIAAEMGVGADAVRGALKRQGVQIRSMTEANRGNFLALVNRRRVLTDEQEDEVFAAHMAGEKTADIAEKYGANVCTIQRTIRKKKGLPTHRKKERGRPVSEAPRSEKTCSKCKVVKPLGDFASDKYRKDGRTTQCLTCRAENRRRYYRTDAGKAAASRANASEPMKKSIRRYIHSKKGKARNRRNSSGEKRKKWYSDWLKTEKGREAPEGGTRGIASECRAGVQSTGASAPASSPGCRRAIAGCAGSPPSTITTISAMKRITGSTSTRCAPNATARRSTLFPSSTTRRVIYG